MGLAGNDDFGTLASLKHGKRILLTQGMDLSKECERAGITFFESPSTLDQFYAAVEAGLNAPPGGGGSPGQNQEEMLTVNTAPPAQHPARPPRIVIVNDNEGPLRSMEIILRGFQGATLSLFQDSSDAWEELLRADPDLLIVHSRMPKLGGVEIIFRLLDRKAAFPVIVTTTYYRDEPKVLEAASRGLNVTVMRLPFDVKDFKALVEGALKNPHAKFENVGALPPEPQGVIAQAPPSVVAPEPQNKRLLRVTILDDEDWRTEMLELAIRQKYPNATVQTIKDGDLALQELTREDPDLVITDVNRDKGLDGYDIVSRLAAKKAKYPVLVYSGLMDKAGEDHVKRLAGPNLPVKCLYCPFTIDQFYGALSELLDRGDSPKFVRGEQDGFTIYIVDDDTELPELTKMILKQLAGRVEIFHNPEIAVQTFNSANPRPDLIITDHYMPEMDGFELIRQVRRIDPKQKFLLTTGHGTVETEQRARVAAIEFLILPYVPEQLMAAVSSLLKHSPPPIEARPAERPGKKKINDEISRDVLKDAAEVALIMEKEGKSRDEAINAGVCHARAHSNLSMLEQVRVRSWLEDELEEMAQQPKGDSKPVSPKPPFLYRVVGPDGTAVIQELSAYVARAKALLNRKTVLVVGAFLVAVAGLFPPWLYTFSASGIHSEKNAGYALILTPPAREGKSEPYGIRLDSSRLVIEWVCIAAAAGAVYFFSAGRNGKREQG